MMRNFGEKTILPYRFAYQLHDGLVIYKLWRAQLRKTLPEVGVRFDARTVPCPCQMHKCQFLRAVGPFGNSAWKAFQYRKLRELFVFSFGNHFDDLHNERRKI